MLIKYNISHILSNIMNLFCLILLSNIGRLAGQNQDVFQKIGGYVVDSYLTETALTGPAGLSKCCLMCLSSASCISFSNNKITGRCRISQFSPYGETTLTKDDNWDTLYKSTDGWKVVFRAVSGNGISVLESLKSEGSSVRTSDCIIPYKTTCNVHYRSDLVDLWEELHISQVKIEAYTGNNRVAFIQFNGTNANFTNWFSQNNLLDSSWSGLQSETTFNSFNIEGMVAAYSRHFYINKQHGGCSNDLGWFMVIDVEPAHHGCLYDTQTRPAILYSFQSSGTYFQTQAYGLADTMLIYVRW